jgi:hypothetical protein
MPRKEEVMQALQQLEGMTIADTASKDNLVTNALQLIGLTVETAGLVNIVIGGDNWET